MRFSYYYPLPVSGIIVRETESYYERNEMGLIEVLNRKVIGVRLYYLFNGKKLFDHSKNTSWVVDYLNKLNSWIDSHI